MNVISKRRSELNKIKLQIRQEKIYIQNDIIAIERMNKNQGSSQWVNEQINIRRAKIDQREKIIDSLQKKSGEVEKGLFDKELLQSENYTHSEIRAKQDDAKKQKDYEKDIKQIALNKSKHFEQLERRADKNLIYNSREIDKSFQYFVKAKETIPEYMIKKLKNMPNNKGYIWKNIYCYGERPPTPREPVILFETQKEGLLVIHEITDKEYKIWHKRGSSKKILHSCNPRRKIGLTACSLANYIKIH
jgi:hypothetical protein